MQSRKKSITFRMLLTGCAILGATAFTGCQTSIGGQTLPSAFYLNDDIQYFPKGPEFKLQREATALKEARARAEFNQ